MIPPFLMTAAGRIGIYAAIAVALFLWGMKVGYGISEGEWQKAALEGAQRTIRVVVKQQEISERVVTEFIQGKERIRTVIREIQKEVPIYVPVQTEPAAAGAVPCVVPAGLVRLLDAAVQLSAARPSAGGADESAATLACADFAAYAIALVEAAHERGSQLTALQEWERRQGELAAAP